MSKAKGLGKGLGALFQEVNLNEDLKSDSDVAFISIHEIMPNKEQPRQQFKNETIEELAESIKQHGVLQPLLVRKIDAGYEIVAGERRFRAARKAGLKEVPCLIKELTDEQNLLISLIENIQREDLNPIDEAMGIERMITQYGMTQESAAKSLGKSRPYIANAVRLLKLDDYVKNALIEKKISQGHAKAICGIDNSEKQKAVTKRCIEEGWTVREVEQFMQGEGKFSERKKPREKKKQANIRYAEELLSEFLGTKVRIISGIKKSKIEIEFYSQEELERLVELFHVKQ